MVKKEGRERSQHADKEMLYGELWFSTSPRSARGDQPLVVPSGSRLAVSMSCMSELRLTGLQPPRPSSACCPGGHPPNLHQDQRHQRSQLSCVRQVCCSHRLPEGMMELAKELRDPAGRSLVESRRAAPGLQG